MSVLSPKNYVSIISVTILAFKFLQNKYFHFFWRKKMLAISLFCFMEIVLRIYAVLKKSQVCLIYRQTWL
jgi:hypothetical protein